MPSALVYLLAYAVLVVGTFAIVGLVAGRGDEATHLDAFRGLSRRRPALALALTILLVAQAGVPFTSGFIAKFGVIEASVDEESYLLAVIAMVSTVIAAFMYLRIIVASWMSDEDDDEARQPLAVPLSSALAIAAAVGFTVAVGLFPEWLLERG